jgi:hypothetical protein
MTYPDKAQLFEPLTLFRTDNSNPFDITVHVWNSQGNSLHLRSCESARAVVSRDPLSDSVCMMCLISRHEGPSQLLSPAVNAVLCVVCFPNDE